jgi:hypothetical protein
METCLDALALLVERADFVAPAIDLDTADLPALLRTGVASGKPGCKGGGSGEAQQHKTQPDLGFVSIGLLFRRRLIV